MYRQIVPLLCVVSLVSACASGGNRVSNEPAPAPATSPAASAVGSVGAVVRWPVKTAAHVDLWLHSFALISDDTTRITLFRRGYKDSITVVKNQANVLTTLDANRVALAKRLVLSPALIQAQFLAMQFNSWETLKTACERFLQFQGDPQRAPNQDVAMEMSQIAGIFSTPEDRDWLRLFINGVQDEYTRFYSAEFSRLLRERSATITAVDSLWQKQYRQKFERFLSNTSQRQGDMLLSLPIGGEGRASAGAQRQTVVAVPFPARPEDASEAILVLAHETTGGVVATVVADNSTPAQKRSGEADTFVATGQVRAGLILLQKIAPELAEPYARFYMRQAGRPVTGVDAVDALIKEFALPASMVDAMARQIDIVLAGI